MHNAINALNIGSSDKLVWFKTNGAAYSPGVVAYNNINNGNFTKLLPTYGTANGLTYVQFDTIMSFSGGTLALDLVSGSPLPLDLLSFKATAVDNHKTQLVWHTANERNVDIIEVERSVSGNSWEFIAMQKALGGYNNVYTAWDLNPLNGNNLYRLKMIDQDGSYNYSKIEKAYFANVGTAAIAVYPNPNSGSFTITAVGVVDAKSSNLYIYDVLGRLVYNASLTEGENTVELNNVANGVYKLLIQNGTRQYTQKVTINK